MYAETTTTDTNDQPVLTMSEPLTASTPLPLPAVKTLADSFAIFSYTLHRYGGQKTDQQASEEIAASKGAEEKAVKVVKNLFAGNNTLKAIVALDGALTNKMKATYPPAGRAEYFVHMADIIKFQRDTFNPFLIERERLVTDFIESAKVTIDGYAFTGKGPLGDMFNRDDYPTERDIRAAFSVDVFLAPVPTNHWLVKHAQDAAAVMGDMYNQGMNKRLNEITDFVKRKIIESLDWASKACAEKELNEEGKLQRKNIHASSVQAFMGLTDLLRKLNINNDNKIEAIAASFEALLAGTSAPALAESLKSDPLMREVIRDQVNAVREMLDF